VRTALDVEKGMEILHRFRQPGEEETDIDDQA